MYGIGLHIFMRYQRRREFDYVVMFRTRTSHAMKKHQQCIRSGYSRMDCVESDGIPFPLRQAILHGLVEFRGLPEIVRVVGFGNRRSFDLFSHLTESVRL